MKEEYRRQDELELRRRERERRRRRMRKERRRRRLMAALGLILVILALLAGIWLFGRLVGGSQVNLGVIQVPDWIEQSFFDENPYSRPGTKLSRADEIVIHYVANPGTDAKQNWNYFNNLANQTGERKTSASSHFIIGPEGTVLQGIPLDEISYATSKEKNLTTISIECCHPDETGKFTDDTYDSLVKLTAWLCEELKLSEKDVIRHYDATGKDCPRYFVEDEEAWELFRKDVKQAIREQKK